MKTKKISQSDLWDRLESFDLDDLGARQKFSDRLAVENGWDQPFALRVIAEYKRFVYLSQIAGHPVTPSDQVDHVWHLHLCYTRSYWSEMCGEILDHPLHHGPTRGGKQEQEKFVDWYAKTLESYQEHFGSAPPKDIWPASRERFAARRFRRIDTAANLIVGRKTLVAGAAALSSVFLFAGCVEYVLDDDGDLSFAKLFIAGICIALVLKLLLKIAGWGGRGGGGGGGCGGGCGGGGWFGGGGDSSGCSSGCGGGGCGGGCGS